MNMNSVALIFFKLFLCLIGLSCQNDHEPTIEYIEYSNYDTIKAKKLEQRVRDNYRILGIKESESTGYQEIRKAFLKRSRACHPDKHPNDKAKEEEFKKINNARHFLENFLLYKNKEIDQETFEELVQNIPCT